MKSFHHPTPTSPPFAIEFQRAVEKRRLLSRRLKSARSAPDENPRLSLSHSLSLSHNGKIAKTEMKATCRSISLSHPPCDRAPALLTSPPLFHAYNQKIARENGKLTVSRAVGVGVGARDFIIRKLKVYYIRSAGRERGAPRFSLLSFHAR